MSSKPHPSLIEGERLALTCVANEATKKIQWTKDDVSEIARASIQQIGNNSTLVIKKVLTSDSGKYSCKAVNEAGSASSSVDIRHRQRRAYCTTKKGTTFSMSNHISPLFEMGCCFSFARQH